MHDNNVHFTGLQEVMEFLEESFLDVPIAIAHGKVCDFISPLLLWPSFQFLLWEWLHYGALHAAIFQAT